MKEHKNIIKVITLSNGDEYISVDEYEELVNNYAVLFEAYKQLADEYKEWRSEKTDQQEQT